MNNQKIKSIKCITENHNIEYLEYERVHKWIKYHYGSASKCDNKNCEKKSDKFDWALKRGLKYEKNRDNFNQLCKSCHSKQDSTEIKKAKLSKAFNSLSEKKCEDCKQTFPMKLAQKVCNKCHKIRRRKSSKKFWHNNIEVSRKRCSLWKKNNKEKVNEYQRKIYKAKRENISTITKKNDKNKEL